VLVDEDVTAWIAGLEELFGRVAGRFFRSEPRRRARAYVRGLLAPVADKNGWTLSEIAGDSVPDGMQRLLNAAAWDADGVRDDLRTYVVEHLGNPDGVLVVDQAGFLKKGVKSAGVQRQRFATTDQIENCQLGIFLAYSTAKGSALIDRELYLPESWTADRERCREASVPEEVGFATKTTLAEKMLTRAFNAGVPARWVTADEFYGQENLFRSWLEKYYVGYVVAVPRDQLLPVGGSTTARADHLVAAAPADVWKRSFADSEPGLHEWATATVPTIGEHVPPGWTRRLLVRRRIISTGVEPEIAYHLCYAPLGTPDEELVRVANARNVVAELIRTAKAEVGLDDYQVRRYGAWYRHITLAMLAHAYLAVTAAVLPAALATATPRSPSAGSGVCWHT
jgi:SRSO17 transposase